MTTTLRTAGAATVAGVALYAFVGHGLHSASMKAMDKAPHGLGICLLVAALAAGPGLGRLGQASVPFRMETLLVPAIPSQSSYPTLMASARASPAWLQRFLR